MPSNTNEVHKIIFHAQSAHTACGKDIMSYYPKSGYATSSEAGQLQFRVTPFNKGVTCQGCKDKIKEDKDE